MTPNAAAAFEQSIALINQAHVFARVKIPFTGAFGGVVLPHDPAQPFQRIWPFQNLAELLAKRDERSLKLLVDPRYDASEFSLPAFK